MISRKILMTTLMIQIFDKDLVTTTKKSIHNVSILNKAMESAHLTLNITIIVQI